MHAPQEIEFHRDRVSDLAQIVSEMGELFRSHMKIMGARIAALEERVQDLEGHAEHGPSGSCGVCAPETVGAESYATGEIAISDFTTECDSSMCPQMISPGQEIVLTTMGWRHRDCA